MMVLAESSKDVGTIFRRPGTIDAHLADRPYLFGARPAFADFAMWGQIYNARRDHTPAEIISESTSHVAPWIDRMLEPEILGDFEPWENLQATLAPLLETQVAALFLPWSVANAKAIETGSEEFDVELASGTWRQVACAWWAIVTARSISGPLAKGRST